MPHTDRPFDDWDLPLERLPTGRLLSLAGRLTESSESRMSPGLTPVARSVLGALRDGRRTQQSLARLLRVTPQTASRLLDRLERDGLVVRRRHSHDRRLVEVALSNQGRSALARHPPGQRDQHDPEEEALRRALIRRIHRLGGGRLVQHPVHDPTPLDTTGSARRRPK